jgi:hypothetical protein
MRFRVSGRDPARIKAFFAKDQIAWRLLELPPGVELDCSEGRCVISISGVAKEEHTIDLLIDAAVEIARLVTHPELTKSSPTDRQP